MFRTQPAITTINPMFVTVCNDLGNAWREARVSLTEAPRYVEACDILGIAPEELTFAGTGNDQTVEKRQAHFKFSRYLEELKQHTDADIKAKETLKKLLIVDPKVTSIDVIHYVKNQRVLALHVSLMKLKKLKSNNIKPSQFPDVDSVDSIFDSVVLDLKTCSDEKRLAGYKQCWKLFANDILKGFERSHSKEANLKQLKCLLDNIPKQVTLKPHEITAIKCLKNINESDLESLLDKVEEQKKKSAQQNTIQNDKQCRDQLATQNISDVAQAKSRDRYAIFIRALVIGAILLVTALAITAIVLSLMSGLGAPAGVAAVGTLIGIAAHIGFAAGATTVGGAVAVGFTALAAPAVFYLYTTAMLGIHYLFKNRNKPAAVESSAKVTHETVKIISIKSADQSAIYEHSHESNNDNKYAPPSDEAVIWKKSSRSSGRNNFVSFFGSCLGQDNQMTTPIKPKNVAMNTLGFNRCFCKQKRLNS